MKRFAFAALTTIGWAFVFFLLVEGYVRFVADDGMQFDLEMWKYARDVKQVSRDPLIGHEHAPNRQAVLMGVDFKTNSRGLRDREFSNERMPGVTRILMLGDSLTVGWGTAYEDIFSKRLEAMFAAKGIKAEVINTGVGNYNTIQEVQYFLKEGYKYRPDIVVLNFFVNDAEPVPRSGHANPFLSNACYSCNFVMGRVDTLLRKFSVEKKAWTEYYLDLYGDGRAKGWLDAKDAMRKLAEYCRAHGIKLVIASLPELHDVKAYPFQKVTQLVEQAAKENGAEFVDVLPHLATQNSADLWVTPPDPHPNALAHKLIAQGLFEALHGMVAAGKNSD